MHHDQFVGQVQNRAYLPSRGDAEAAIRATLETLGERLQKESAAHLAAQLPPEIGRHLKEAERFEHLALDQFFARVAVRESTDIDHASLHAQAVMQTIADAVTPGLVGKVAGQLPPEYAALFGPRWARDSGV